MFVYNYFRQVNGKQTITEAEEMTKRFWKERFSDIKFYPVSLPKSVFYINTQLKKRTK